MKRDHDLKAGSLIYHIQGFDCLSRLPTRHKLDINPQALMRMTAGLRWERNSGPGLSQARITLQRPGKLQCFVTGSTMMFEDAHEILTTCVTQIFVDLMQSPQHNLIIARVFWKTPGSHSPDALCDLPSAPAVYQLL